MGFARGEKLTCRKELGQEKRFVTSQNPPERGPEKYSL